MESAKNSGATISKRNPKCPGLETNCIIYFSVFIFLSIGVSVPTP
jgi:hypothetical protein